jgi:hypothetical protein
MLIIGGDANISSTPAFTEDLPELNAVVARFYRLSKVYMPPDRPIVPSKKITIQFANLDDTVIGLCQRPIFKSVFRPILTIDRNFWKTADSGTKEQLVFHELGHCALGRLHNDAVVNFLNIKVGVSIMHSYLDAVPTPLYIIEREHYLTELFQAP